MFGTNSIIGKKFFKNAPEDSLFVTSIFFTLQGEGPFAGQPAVFVRLTKCNLNCHFCDTFFDDGDWMTFDEINEKIIDTISAYWEDKGLLPPGWAVNPKLAGPTCPGVVLVMTGGEPLLQDNISAFMESQIRNFKEIQVESNGILDTLVPTGVTLVCSPKCAEKNGTAIKYLEPSKTILERADCLKFVMTADKNSPYNTIPDWALEWKNNNPDKEIYVSPMNVYNTFPQKIKLLRAESKEITLAQRSTVDEVISFWEPGLLNLKENQDNHEYTARYCMNYGLRLNLQMHLYASLA